jgi:S1-C subfamily serine protease
MSSWDADWPTRVLYDVQLGRLGTPARPRKATAKNKAWLLIVWLALAPHLARAEVPQAVLDAEQSRIAAIATAVPSAVAVFATDGKGGGSGVVITADGYALSNYHVTSPVGNFMKCGMSDGQLYDAVIVGIDPTGDVALIKLFGRDDFPAAEMANSDDVRAGDWCFAAGNPFLLATDFRPTVTFGIVSGVHRYQYPAGTLLEYTDCIQTDAAINPGNSGGPLFNDRGQLIGINGRGSFEKRGRVNVGLGYAISINQIKNFLGHLHSGRIVDHATLGATAARDEGNRVIVSNILETSDAYRRGLRYGDQIIAFGGRTIDSVNAFKNVLGVFPRGWRVPLSFIRSGQQYDIHVRLAGVHAREALVAQIQKGPKEMPHRPGQPKEERRRPDRIPLSTEPPEEAVPEELAKFYETRNGFANYYFNQLHQDRVWNAFQALGQFRDSSGEWTLVGHSSDGEDIIFQLGDERSSGTFPRGETQIDASVDLSDQTGPSGSGGLLATLHLWRRLLRLGPQDFGQVVYLGTAPLPDGAGRFDVLIANYDVAELTCYFDPQSGQLRLIEMSPDSGVDPCEIYFEDYREVDGRSVAQRLIVRHGDSLFTEFELEKASFGNEVRSET